MPFQIAIHNKHQKKQASQLDFQVFKVCKVNLSNWILNSSPENDSFLRFRIWKTSRLLTYVTSVTTIASLLTAFRYTSKSISSLTIYVVRINLLAR